MRLTTGRRQSLRGRLTALIFAILGLLGVAFGWVAYEQVHDALRFSGTERIEAAAAQVAELLSQSAASRVHEARRLAADAEVARAVTADTPEAGASAVQAFVTRNPPATVWGYDRTRRFVRRLGAGREALPGAVPPPLAPPEGVSGLQIGDGRVWYHTTVAIRQDDRSEPSGFVSIQRSVRSSQAAQLIERLIGSRAVLRFGNAGNDVWSDLSLPATAPPIAGVGTGSAYRDPSGEEWIGIAVPVPETPWLVWVAVPEETMLGPADALLRRLTPVTLFLIGIGVVGVYVASGRMTRPLDTLAQAADAIAAGDYTRRVAVNRQDEVGRLASVFNAMAERVASAHDSLEARVVERTQQLEAANAALSERESELRRATAFLDSIVENLPAMVFVKDARDLQYILFNRAGEELLGMQRAELLGRTDRDLFPPAIAEGFASRDADVLRRGVAVSVVDEVIETRDKGGRILHTKQIPILNPAGAPEYLLGISLDITERRNAEEAARVATLEAERANRAKSQFLSRMSHDLRTPLNAMLGFAQLLESDEHVSAEHREHVRHILKGGSHLLQLVNEVLDIARIESGGLSLSVEPVRVSEVLHDVLELMRPLAEARGISLVVVAGQDQLHVLADNQRVKQILLNLVGNAVKYNRTNGAVQIAVVRSAGRVRISVHDTGPGIPPEKRGLLFRPFERLGAEQGDIEGTGLGLALAKGLIEAMNGTIGVDLPDEGSTFWMELPEAQSSERQRINLPDPAVDVPQGSGAVLYIEDNHSNVRLVERLLSRRPGVRLLTAGAGAQGIAAATREIPDLILLDLHLPDMSGEDVLKTLLLDSRTATIPVVVLSADAIPAQRERLLRAGARAYLTKPIVLSALLASIDQHLGDRNNVPGDTHHLRQPS